MSEKSSPDSSENDNLLKAEKRRKLADLRKTGINPYPYSFDRTHATTELKERFEKLAVGEKALDHSDIRVAGRIMAKRPMGKAAFLNLADQKGSLQIYLKVEELSGEHQKAFEFLDIGDIVGVEGFMFRTQKGELSLHAKKFQMLCKTLEPLPEKYHGLADVELRYRYRHLDLIMNPETRMVFETRTKVIKEIRAFLDGRGFLEVETPILQPIYGGAAAKPFQTHHNALDMTLFMKISPELYLKRLIVGGFEKVYDLNKNFRNEGIDRSHNPEFAMIEWYEAYTDYNYQMKQFEELVAHVCEKIHGTTKITYQGKPLDFKTPWTRLSMTEAIKKFGGYDVEGMPAQELFKIAQKHGTRLDKPTSKGEMLAHVFELVCEEHLWDPVFIIDHPYETSPLTKNHRTKPGFVERFEPFAACMEIGNSYSELNDPEDQRARLKEQEAKRVVDEEAQPMDEDFLHAIDVGMPPTGGVGLGVERIVMLLTDRPSIRDIIFFPTMKMK